MKTTISFQLEGSPLSSIDSDLDVSGDNLYIPAVGDHIGRPLRGEGSMPFSGVVLHRHFTFFDESVTVILVVKGR
jgi:hypothetical protein